MRDREDTTLSSVVRAVPCLLAAPCPPRGICGPSPAPASWVLLTPSPFGALPIASYISTTLGAVAAGVARAHPAGDYTLTPRLVLRVAVDTAAQPVRAL